MTARENFPVGSVLIRRDLRAAVSDFYAFARGADDAADDPAAPPAQRLARLDRFEAGLDGREGGAPEGLRLRARLAALGRPAAIRHARQLLVAFRWDAATGEVETWADLLRYCDSSANPVGRFLLDLHGEGARAVPSADALCTALQVLNHVQDIRPDRERLGRCYVPADWLAAEGAAHADLVAPAASPALRRAIGRALDGCDALLDGAAALPDALASRRLAGESATILRLARGLSRRLRAGDPLAARIRPGAADFGLAAVWGLVVALRPRMMARTARGRA